MKEQASSTRWSLLWQIVWIIFGAMSVAVAIRLFLVPNEIIDGGVVGISMIVSSLSHISLALLLFLLNAPFLYIGYKQMGVAFAFRTLLGIAVMSIGTAILPLKTFVTQDPLLAAVFGGIVLGIGVGLVIRHGGSLDGAEIVAILISKRTAFSVGEIILFINFFVLSSAGLVFGIDNAMYSLITFFIAYKVIDITMDGFQESRSVWVISDHPRAIGDEIGAQLGRSVTYFEGEGGFTGQHKKVIFCVITKLEEVKLKRVVDEVDPEAFLTIGMVSEVRGRRYRTKKHG